MERTKIFLKRKFKEYYEKNSLIMPVEFKKREWAFVPLDVLPQFTMHRHIAFNSEHEVKNHILSSIPANIYFSSAYYNKPSAEKMEQKGWEGADLIFDIDADHLPVKVKSIQSALKLAKEEIFKLLDILTDDFGIDEKEIMVVFSGGRGYHLHVHNEDFRKLDSAERREIIDYLMINDVKFDKIPETSQGRRIYRSMRELSGYIIEKNHLNTLLKKLNFRGKVEDVEIILNSGRLNRLTGSKSKRRLFEYLFTKAVEKVKVNIDAPVTADVKRLIRLPDSLHGRTGLRASPVSINNLDEFEPLRDARAFGDEKVKVRVRRVRKEDLSWAIDVLKKYPRAGDRIKVPEYLGIFMLCRGMAQYGH